MVLRIETSGITRGREFSLYAFSDSVPAIEAYAYNPVTREVVPLDCVHGKYGMLHRFEAVAPHFDGFLMAKIGRQKIVKRIGTPIQIALVVGWKEGYTAFYKAFDYQGNVIGEGAMDHLVGPFFACSIPDDAVMMEAAGKRFLVNRNISRMNYRITMEGGELHSSFDPAILGNVDLPDVTFEGAELGDVTLDSTLPNITIEEL
ncbi:hypothetical protein [Nitratifractor sp.]